MTGTGKRSSTSRVVADLEGQRQSSGSSLANVRLFQPMQIDFENA
jgi:hypothetical protein